MGATNLGDAVPFLTRSQLISPVSQSLHLADLESWISLIAYSVSAQKFNTWLCHFCWPCPCELVWFLFVPAPPNFQFRHYVIRQATCISPDNTVYRLSDANHTSKLCRAWLITAPSLTALIWSDQSTSPSQLLVYVAVKLRKVLLWNLLVMYVTII
jgi:hypothetical protein